MRHSFLAHSLGLLALLSVPAAGAAIVMLLWNALLPALCGFAAVTYWQALGLLALGLTLSGAMLLLVAALCHSLHPAHRGRSREMRTKWRSMTEEQRREFLGARGFGMRTDR